MRVFLSWSGERSKRIALQLRDWIPQVLHSSEAWLSIRDVSAGSFWALELQRGLNESKYGVLCLTPENLTSPWILYEAGVLARALPSNAVCPYLLNVEFEDLPPPLSQFQAKKAQEESTLEMLQSMNAIADSPVSPAVLSRSFSAFWPELERTLQETFQVQRSENASRIQQTMDVISGIRFPAGHPFPDDETSVLDRIREALCVASLSFFADRRESERGKPYQVDLFNSVKDIGIKVKLCRSARDIKVVAEEIMAFIRTYRHPCGVIFVIYHHGCISDKPFRVQDPKFDGIHLVVMKH